VSGVSGVSGVAFSRLVRVELRKSVDTRSARALLLGLFVCSDGVLLWGATRLDGHSVAFGDVLSAVMVPINVVLPAVGLLAMTNEWSQRTALTTFTLTPRRTAVLLAKVVSALALSTLVVVAAVVVALAGTVAGGWISGRGATYRDALPDIAGTAIADELRVLIGASIGMVTMATGAAVIAFYVAPPLWEITGTTVLGGGARWADIVTTLDNLQNLDFTQFVPQMATASVLWVVLPAVVGLILANRRDIT
jgi:hypothetical protein